MLEQGYYIFLIMIMIFMIMTPIDQNVSNLKQVFLFGLLLGLSIVVRSNPHNDIPVYIDSFSLPISSMISDPYYLKNVLFWIPSAFLNQYVFGSEYAVLLFWDSLTFLLLLRVSRRLELPLSTILVYLVSFMGLLTLQNVYRQYIATILFLYAFTVPRSKRLLAYGVLFFSVLIHSSLFLFAPVLYLHRRKTALSPLLFLGLNLGVAIVLSFATKKDFSYNTGLNMNGFYLALILSMACFMWRLILFLRCRIPESHRLLQPLVYISLLALICFLIMGSSLYYERVALIGLQILLILLYYCLSKLSWYWSAGLRFAAAMVFVLPIFFFESTEAMLQNASWLNG